VKQGGRDATDESEGGLERLGDRTRKNVPTRETKSAQEIDLLYTDSIILGKKMAQSDGEENSQKSSGEPDARRSWWGDDLGQDETLPGRVKRFLAEEGCRERTKDREKRFGTIGDPLVSCSGRSCFIDGTKSSEVRPLTSK